jgi:hypothetical protein
VITPGIDVDAFMAGFGLGVACFGVIFAIAAGLTVIRRFLDV